VYVVAPDWFATNSGIRGGLASPSFVLPSVTLVVFVEPISRRAFALFSKLSIVLNNKKTDEVFQETKNGTWRKVEQEFTASNTVGVFHNEKSLGKLFDNSIAIDNYIECRDNCLNVNKFAL
jgi:hypothetical protein